MELSKFSSILKEAANVLIAIVLWAVLVSMMRVYMGLADALTASATIILVVITAYYAKATHEILEETRKDRKIRYIELRLEKLYYPIRLDEDPIRGGFYEKLRDQLGNFQYLGSKRLRKELDDYLDACRKGDGTNNREHYQKIKKIVEDEIPQMINDLGKLM
ncbi:MAG: hypothetical protein AABX40_03765 [Candidatus Hydrothermarchaeota archaeon]